MSFFPFVPGYTSPTIAYVGATTDGTNTSTYTFSSQSLGTPTGKIVVVAVHGESSSSRSISSVTVDGSSATVVSQGTARGALCGLAYVTGITATSGDIVVTLSGSADRCIVAVYTIADYSSATPTASDTDDAVSGTGGTLTATIPFGGVAICAWTVSTDQAVTWTNATEQYDAVVSGTRYSGATVAASGETRTSYAVTVTHANSTDSIKGIMAVWQ